MRLERLCQLTVMKQESTYETEEAEEVKIPGKPVKKRLMFIRDSIRWFVSKTNWYQYYIETNKKRVKS